MDFQSVADAWVDNPGPGTLAPLMDEIQAQPNYYVSPDFSGAVAALRSGDTAEALDELLALMPGAFLSPLAHSLLADVYDARYRDAEAVRERALARASLVTILSSGDGTLERPWIVLRISDEYDVLAQLGERCALQTPAEESHRVVDRIATVEGNTYYFELRRAGRRVTRGAA